MAIAVNIKFAFWADQTGRASDVRLQPLKADGTATGPAISGATATGGAGYTLSANVPDDTVYLSRYMLAVGGGSVETYLEPLVLSEVQALNRLAAGTTPGQTRLISTPLHSGRVEPVRYTRGATGPVLRDWLVDGAGSRIDLTGYTITATMLNYSTGAAVFTAAAASLGNAPEEGQVELDWPAGALSTVGQYRLIWYAGGPETITWTTLVVVE